MKNNKGVSIITLTITIIVMIILAGIAIVVSRDGVDMANDARIENEKKQLQNAITSRFAGYLRSKDAYPLEGVKIQSAFDEEVTNDVKVQQSLNEIVTHLEGAGRYTVEEEETKNKIQNLLQKNINHIEYTRIIGASEMLALGLTNVDGNISYYYVVNYYSADIIGPIS